MASRNYLVRFWSKKRRRQGDEERETELTLSPGVITLAMGIILAGLVAGGVIPADIFARVAEKVLLR